MFAANLVKYLSRQASPSVGHVIQALADAFRGIGLRSNVEQSLIGFGVVWEGRWIAPCIHQSTTLAVKTSTTALSDISKEVLPTTTFCPTGMSMSVRSSAWLKFFVATPLGSRVAGLSEMEKLNPRRWMVGSFSSPPTSMRRMERPKSAPVGGWPAAP